MDSNSRDIDLVHDMFDRRDANINLFIPLDKDVEDSWYWRHEKLGNYSKKALSSYAGRKRRQCHSNKFKFLEKVMEFKDPAQN